MSAVGRASLLRNRCWIMCEAHKLVFILCLQRGRTSGDRGAGHRRHRSQQAVIAGPHNEDSRESNSSAFPHLSSPLLLRSRCSGPGLLLAWSAHPAVLSQYLLDTAQWI